MNESNPENMIEKSTEWLFSEQEKEKGGWGERHGTLPNSLNTAEVIIGLLEGGNVYPGDIRIQKGIAFLKGSQIDQGPDRGAWAREIHKDINNPAIIPDLIRSSIAIQAMIKAGGDSESVRKCVDWIQNIRNSDNGWGYRRGSKSEVLPTCFALMALIDAHKARIVQCDQQISEGLKLIIEEYKNESDSIGVPDYLEALHTIYSLLALQAARKSNLSKYYKEEEKALDWLLQNPDKANRIVEERNKIDPIRDIDDNGEHDYGMLFMTDSLILKVLFGANNVEYHNTELARNAMISIGDRKHDSGGFYGNRVFYWSTAQAICGLNQGKMRFKEMPWKVTPKEYTGAKAGAPIMAFATILAIIIVILTAMGRFELIQAIILAFLMLACLLAYQQIGEKTFKELFTIWIKSLK